MLKIYCRGRKAHPVFQQYNIRSLPTTWYYVGTSKVASGTSAVMARLKQAR